DRIDADLELGRHDAVVAELESLAGRYPLRERLRAQLMLALYRSGRQAEALRVYHDARRTLVDELGLEPGLALQQLHAGILRQARDWAPGRRVPRHLRPRVRAEPGSPPPRDAPAAAAVARPAVPADRDDLVRHHDRACLRGREAGARRRVLHRRRTRPRQVP